MDNQKLIVESLAMDLKRVALGFYRGSYKMADRFRKEALDKSKELENSGMDRYLNKLITGMKKGLSRNNEKGAEDALMYSTLFQNFALKKMSGK